MNEARKLEEKYDIIIEQQKQALKIMIYPLIFVAVIFVFLCVSVVLFELSLPISFGIWATILLLVSAYVVRIRRKCHGGGSR